MSIASKEGIDINTGNPLRTPSIPKYKQGGFAEWPWLTDFE